MTEMVVMEDMIGAMDSKIVLMEATKRTVVVRLLIDQETFRVLEMKSFCVVAIRKFACHMYVTVSVIAMMILMRILYVKSKIEVEGHIKCERYAIIVKLRGSVIRYMQYKYVPNVIYFTPNHLRYDRKTNILRWQATIPICLIPVFYVKSLKNRSNAIVEHNYFTEIFQKQIL
ncbi:hypothetical protein RF11_06164 [Thelohanellus kitauei]|uniref:Uncharacterized protein n=1 Tax=Thelohanellus kitauei TaxID=669202 RepID=A0A0C2J2C7_THEKT|nr:hypothetical protein RF11_06164 [Thelohanellus kitauei]